MLGTAVFFAFVIYLALVIVDDVVMWFIGRSIIPFVYRPEPTVGFYGVLAILLGIPLLYLLSSIWLWLKRRWTKDVDYDDTIPRYANVDDLAEYFDLPVSEVERRQNAGILIIAENIDNERMKVLRERAAERNDLVPRLRPGQRFVGGRLVSSAEIG